MLRFRRDDEMGLEVGFQGLRVRLRVRLRFRLRVTCNAEAVHDMDLHNLQRKDSVLRTEQGCGPSRSVWIGLRSWTWLEFIWKLA